MVNIRGVCKRYAPPTLKNCKSCYCIKNGKVVDPACGSGSFLVGAYKYLLDWYLNQYTIDIKKIKAYLKPDINGYIRLEKKYTKNDITEYKLTIKEKQRILLKHIYGVDIDFNATEVTKLSLFLVLLNDEGIDGGNNDLSFIKLLDYKLLPNMTNNIKCGNSLIGTDYYLGNFIKQFTVDEQTKINAFDWGKEFEEIFRNGGFDIVIGNPPYGISIENEQRLYIEQQLGKIPDFEIYYCFMQKAFIIAKNGAVVSFIVPNTWLFNVFASNFRTEVLTKWNIVEILDCTNIEIFETAKVRNSIFVFKKTKANNEKIAYKQTKTMNSFYKLISQETQYTSKDKLLFMNANWGLVFQLSERYISIIQNIIKKSKQLIEYFPEVSQGLIPYDKYKGQSIQTIKNRVFHYNKYKKGLKKNLWGEDVTRYNIIWNGKEWIDYCEGIANPREPKYFIGNRLLIREITNPRIFAACTDEEMYNDPAILIVKDSNKYSIKVLEAIFNSKLATFYHFNHSPKATKGSFPKILIKDVKEFPLPKVDEKLKNIIETLVDQMVESMKNITKSFTEQEKKNTKDIVNAIDRKIDEKVYELYKLSKEDIKIIENTIK